MLVSSATSLSSPGGALRFGVLFRDDAMLSAGDIRPFMTGVAVAALLTPGLPPIPSPGRIVGTLRVWLEPRPGPEDAMLSLLPPPCCTRRRTLSVVVKGVTSDRRLILVVKRMFVRVNNATVRKVIRASELAVIARHAATLRHPSLPS